METLTFKTNIKCSGCIEKVGPQLDKTVGTDRWTVDLQSADKVLTVHAEKEKEQAIIRALNEVGYRAEKI